MDILQKLVQIDRLNLHIVECEKQLFNEFISEMQENISSSTYLAVVDGNKITNLTELFNIFSIAFEFPDYFGNNWAAFDECINDLDWLNASSYILVIEHMDSILDNKQNFNTFIRIICQTANEWQNGRKNDSFPTSPTPFHIVFGVNFTKGNELKKGIIAQGFENIELFKI